MVLFCKNDQRASDAFAVLSRAPVLQAREGLPERCAPAAGRRFSFYRTREKAIAGCCPPAVPTCMCPAPGPQIYVVEHGPIFTGPGPCLRQAADPAPQAYPYVGPVFTGYPYGGSGQAVIRGASTALILGIPMRSPPQSTRRPTPLPHGAVTTGDITLGVRLMRVRSRDSLPAGAYVFRQRLSCS